MYENQEKRTIIFLKHVFWKANEEIKQITIFY